MRSAPAEILAGRPGHRADAGQPDAAAAHLRRRDGDLLQRGASLSANGTVNVQAAYTITCFGCH